MRDQTKRRRLLIYFAVSAGLWALFVAMQLTGGRGYDANRRPDAIDFMISVWTYILIPAVYGCFAVAPAMSGPRRTRVYYVGAAAVGLIATTIEHAFDSALSGLDCRPDCAPAVPTGHYFIAVYLVSLVLTVVTPLLLAFVPGPSAEPMPGRSSS